MNHTIQNWVHIIWTTDRRKPLLTPEKSPQLIEAIKEFCKEQDFYLDIIAGSDDHLHLLMQLPAGICLFDLVDQIKRHSENWACSSGLYSQFRWSSRFTAYSVSKERITVVRRHILRQESYHETHSIFQEMWMLDRGNLAQQCEVIGMVNPSKRVLLELA